MSDTADAPVGVVLCGGASRRMGHDKGALELVGTTQVARAAAVLRSVVDDVFVSVRAEQAEWSAYRSFPKLIDDGATAGPAAGLAAAWQAMPGAALLVLAVDMPLVDETTLGELMVERDTGAIATAFRHADGTPEPLCTIWETAARAVLESRAAAGRRDVSLRRILEDGNAHLITPRAPWRLAGANTPAAYTRLARRARRP